MQATEAFGEEVSRIQTGRQLICRKTLAIVGPLRKLKIPPDDVGNHEERDIAGNFVHDNLGNSVDEEPSHLRSGILSQLGSMKSRPAPRRNDRRPAAGSSSAARLKPLAPPPRPPMVAKPKSRPVEEIPTSLDAKDLSGLSSEDYMARLTSELTRLLRLRLGVPFSFSMKPLNDGHIDEDAQEDALVAIESLIRDIFTAASIVASVSFSEYHTAKHRFAVFYVSPKEKDPLKNKDLISAVRQIVNLHSTKFPLPGVNILLVLANARHVIEDHLFKLGANKID